MIQILNRILNGLQLNKVNRSWCPVTNMELLMANLDYTSVIVTHHVRREADKLGNRGIDNPREECNQT